MLLHTIKGPTNFQDLHTFEGKVCETYRKACHLHSQLEDDGHWDATLKEAAATQTPVQTRQLFAIMLQTCGLSSPMQLWEKHTECMAEDILLKVQKQNPQEDINYNDTIFNKALIRMEDQIIAL